MPAPSDRAIVRITKGIYTAFGDDVRRQREDAGLSLRSLARASGVDASYLARIELGLARPSLETMARISIPLGSDLSTRLYPNTGPLVRDRFQAPIAEALAATAHSSWERYVEIAVRRPSRGWIDLGFHSRGQALFVATEIQSELRRIEQIVRWSEAKAASLPSWEGWGRIGPTTNISRMLVVRDTEATRRVAGEFRRLLRTAYPADPEDALAAVVASEPWPAAAPLWAKRDRATGRYRIVARP